MAEDQLDLTTWLAELEAERVKLDLMIVEVRRRLGQPSNETGGGLQPLPGAIGVPTAASQPGRIRPDEFFRMSIPEAIKRYLTIMKQPQGPKAIAGGLKAGGLLTNAKHFYANVFTALGRLREADQVVNTPNGWGLSDWYPSKPKTAEDAKPKKKHRAKGAKGSKGDAAKPSAYRTFISEAMKSGKTMAQAAEEWRKREAGASGDIPTAKLTVA